ncbi:MAG: hypothetical protein PHY48_05460 [Candidatus Cloacimonetes bacterium]|nr:hypothetical protein [Candidatus Cloacimonadota bacterium]
MKAKLLVFVALLIILSSCAAPKAGLPRKVEDKSKPNIVSIYYYFSASFLHYSGDFLSAGDLYRLALAQDRESEQIRKQILINSAYAYISDQVTAEETIAEFAKARATMSFDLDLLNAVYSVYNKAEDRVGMESVINESIEKYPSCRVYLQKFYTDFANQGIKDTKYLDKAYKHAAKNADELILTARMYALVNPKRAIAILNEAKLIDAKPEIDKLLNELYLSSAPQKDILSFFRAYTYPNDKDAMKNLLQSANQTQTLTIVLSLQNDILATQDASLFAELAFAAYMKDDVATLNRIHAALASKTPEPIEDADCAVFLLAESLFSDEMGQPQVFGDMLYGIQDVDDMMLYRTLRYTVKLQKEEIVSNSNFYDDLVNACQKRLPDAPLSRYIIAAQTDTLATDPAITAARAELSGVYTKLNRGYERDWIINLTDIHLRNLPEERIAMLRKAVEKFHNNSLFLNDLGYSLLEFPDAWDEAGKLISSALALEPSNAYYHDSMAWYYYLKNDFAKAMEHVELPMKMDKIPGEIAYHIGMIYKADNQNQTAIYYFNTALADTNFPVYQQKAKEQLTNIGIEP